MNDLQQLSNMCFDCPHNPEGEGVPDGEELELMEQIASEGKTHPCHNYPHLACAGSLLKISI